MDKKNILICVGAGLFIIVLIVFGMFLRKIRKTYEPPEQEEIETTIQVHPGTSVTKKKSENPSGGTQEIIFEGIDNLFFITFSEHETFKNVLTDYLHTNGIESKGVVSQVGNILEASDTGYIYFLYVPGKSRDIYLKGEYDIVTGQYKYAEEKEQELLKDLVSKVCTVDEQEAPEIEFTNLPAVITNPEALSGILTDEEFTAFISSLTVFLEQHNEVRREFTIDRADTITVNGLVSFNCLFNSPRTDGKNINVKYTELGFTFNMR